MGGWMEGEKMRVGVSLEKKKHLLTEPGLEKQCDSVQLLYTAH